eukprot:123715_1
MSARSKPNSLELIVWYFVRTEFEYENKVYLINASVAPALKHLIKHFSNKIIPSNMLTLNEDTDFFQSLSSGISSVGHIKFNLLYRASENAFSAYKFHELCDNHAPTICIIQSENNHIFGGYTSIKWSSDHGYKTDNKAFLFLIRSQTKNEKCPVLFECKCSDTAVCHWKGRGPLFGGGFDIQIADKCSIWDGKDTDFDNCNYSSGNSEYYSITGNQLCGGNVSKHGAYFFRVIEYEVFELKCLKMYTL